ncbi:MAG: Carboxymuconolactone decarboxylase family protein [Pseudoclavibacter caeni]|jgi:AhpD family alkylhydroperoxidase
MAYQEPEDSRFTRVYQETTPDVLEAFGAFNQAVFSDERTVPKKYLELIAVGVALTPQCSYCIDAHSKAAVAAGATEQELAEAAWVAAAIRSGGAFAHGRLAFKLSGADHQR